MNIDITGHYEAKFVKTDDNFYINSMYIAWIKQMDECLEICAKTNGCGKRDTHKICKINNPKNYDFLMKLCKG